MDLKISKSLTSSWSIFNLIKWDTQTNVPLNDFVHSFSIPHLCLVTSGQLGTIGAPDSNNPYLKPYLYLHCKRMVKKLIGQVIKTSKDGKSLLSVTDNIVSVSDLFKGYFEILSEDGKPVNSTCIESVADLNEKFPELIILRQECKCYVADGFDGELKNLDKKRSLKSGEVLTIVGRFHLKRRIFLRCFDESGSSIFLKMNQKIKCSPVAQRGDLAGVHDVSSLLKMRLPLTVRLVSGRITDRLLSVIMPHQSNFKLNFLETEKPPCLTLRLRKMFKEQCVLGYSVRKPEGDFVCIPNYSPLKLAPIYNQANVAGHYDLRRLSEICDDALVTFSEKIDLLSSNSDIFTTTSNSTMLEKLGKVNGFVNRNVSKEKSPGFISDEEIELLYAYVRGSTDERKNERVTPQPPPTSTIPRSLAANMIRVDEMENAYRASRPTTLNGPPNITIPMLLHGNRHFRSKPRLDDVMGIARKHRDDALTSPHKNFNLEMLIGKESNKNKSTKCIANEFDVIISVTDPLSLSQPQADKNENKRVVRDADQKFSFNSSMEGGHVPPKSCDYRTTNSQDIIYRKKHVESPVIYDHFIEKRRPISMILSTKQATSPNVSQRSLVNDCPSFSHFHKRVSENEQKMVDMGFDGKKNNDLYSTKCMMRGKKTRAPLRPVSQYYCRPKNNIVNASNKNSPLNKSFVTLVTLDDQRIDIQNNVCL